MPQCDTYRNKRHTTKRRPEILDSEDVNKSTQSPHSDEEVYKSEPVKNYATISTQCEFEMNQPIDSLVDANITKKLEVFQDLLPQISSVIEKSQKNLEREFLKVFRPPKIVQERGVSPIKDILEISPLEDHPKKENGHSIPKTPPNSPYRSWASPEPFEAQHAVDSIPTQSNSYSTHIGDLLLNIQNIKDSRCLLDGFQNELVKLKKDIQTCSKCNEANENIEGDNYCGKHVVYIPLLKVGDKGSKDEQIKLFNALRTEVYLKKELENQIQHISKLERKFTRVKKGNDSEKIKAIEKELELAKSYFNNLLVKQQNERLLSEQQKIMSDGTRHECGNVETCEKCCLELQIHDLLKKVRTNIAKDIEDSKQRLKIQRMPTIDIRKPLQMQNILKLDIPPSVQPQIPRKSNFAYESVVKYEEVGDPHQNKAEQTKILLNRSTSFEIFNQTNGTKKKHASLLEPKNYRSPSNIADNFEKNTYSISEGKRHEETESREHFSEKNRELPEKMGKTPSELGFRRNISTQCDSNASLVEPKKTTELSDPFDLPFPQRKTVRTQTVGISNDSSYLFGFKEYLMKKSRGSGSSNLVDVNLQVSLNETYDSNSEFRSVGVNTVPQTRESKNKSCEFQGVTAVMSLEDDEFENADKDETIGETEVQEELPVGNLDTMSASQASPRHSKSIQRTPSLKKMFLLPQNTENQHTELETSIQNPYLEPKYRMKRFSMTRQGSDSETKPQHVDDYYKSLIEKEELPERKTAVLVESHPSDPRVPVEPIVQKTNLKNSNLVEDTRFEYKDNDQDTEIFAASQDARKSTSRDLALTKLAAETRASIDDQKNLTLKTPRKRSLSIERLYEYMEDVEISDREETQNEIQPFQNMNRESQDESPEYMTNDPTNGESAEAAVDGSTPIDQNLEETGIVDMETVQQEEQTSTKDAANVGESIDEQQVAVKEQLPNDKNNRMPENTVLSIFPPEYKFLLNRSREFKTKSTDENIFLRFPIQESTKSFKKIEPSHRFFVQSDEINLAINAELSRRKNDPKKISELYNNDKFIITSSPQSKKNKSNVTNYILHEPILEDKSSKHLSDIPKLAKERLEYSRKCSNINKSLDSSSVASSEGEVVCKCKNISAGEIHSCPRGRINNFQRDQSGIQYKKNLSSHIFLENERKHYNHWVTYYATKKHEHDSSSSSVESENVENK